MNISTQAINTILQRLDIEGLIESGAPSDEYGSEAEIIAFALKELKIDEINNANLQAIILETWKNSFDLSAADLQTRQAAFSNAAVTIVKSHFFQLSLINPFFPETFYKRQG